MSARSALALPARLERPRVGGTRPDPPTDDELDMLQERARALGRLHPVKVRLLGLIADEMLREAREIKQRLQRERW